MSRVRRSVKDVLSAQASVRLAQLGHSDAMITDAKREAWWWLQARGEALARGRGLVRGSAVVWTAPGRTELVAIDVPKAGAGQLTVEVAASAVSTGTERAQYLRLPSASVDYPYRPGYSAAGTVVGVGAGVSRFQPGDAVAVRNLSHASVGTVPEAHVYEVPTGVSLQAASLLQLGIICGQGIRRAALAAGEPVCVIGAGLVGALAGRYAAALGAASTTVVARSRSKEAVARRGGATSFIAVDEGTARVGALASPVVIEATGDPAVIALAVEAAGPGGRVVLLGSPRGITPDVPVATIRDKRLHLVGAHVETLRYEARLTREDAYRREGERFLELLAAGRLDVGDLVGLAIDPREADAFYRSLARDRHAVGAHFDWTRLVPEDRLRRGNLVLLPDLTGRGADERRPLQGGRRRSSLLELPDPFAHASGRLRIGLVGCGDIAVHNASAATEAPNVELVACFDPVAELADDLAGRFGCEPVCSGDALIGRRDVDAVLLSVPHDLHAPLGIEAAAAGKHVIVEKPLANNLDAAVELVQATERAGVVLSVCFPQRYLPSVQAARRLIAAGALGEFAGMVFNLLMDKPPSYWLGGFSGRAQSSWRTSLRQAGGGVLIMNLSHYIDLVRYLTGLEVDHVTSRGLPMDAGSEVEDVVSATLRYENGALGSLFASTALRGSSGVKTELRLFGHDGQIALEPEPLVYTLRALNGLRTGRWHAFGSPSTNMRAVYLSRLASALHEGRPADVTGQDGLATQAIIEAAYRSEELARSVRPAELLAASR